MLFGVNKFQMALHQNESENTEAIKEAKALCTSTIREAKAHWATLISEAEAWHATCIREAKANCASTIAEVEGCCSTSIRKAESHGAKEACIIQLSHAKGMQCLETEAIEEEGKDHLSFLATCGTALQAIPPEAHGMLMTPCHLLMGNAPLFTLLNIPPGILHLTWMYPTSPSVYNPHGTQALTWIQMAIPLPWLACTPPWLEGIVRGISEEPPHSKHPTLHKALMGSQQEAFTRDLDLVWKVREDYFKTNCPHFNCKNSHDLTDIFWDTIASAGLLGSQIYMI